MERPPWVTFIEDNDMEGLEQELQERGLNPAHFDGKIGLLGVEGQWTALGVACFMDNGVAIAALLKFGVDPYQMFKKKGESFNALAYCKAHDKNFAWAALMDDQEEISRGRSETANKQVL
jgi:hypothetical protein